MRFVGRFEIFSRGTRWVISRELAAADDARALGRSLAASMVDGWCDDVTTWPDMLELYQELTGTMFRPPTRDDVDHWVKPSLRSAFQEGKLIALTESPFGHRPEEPEKGVHGQVTKWEPPSPPPPPRRPVATPKTLFSFAVRFVDELGTPISGVDLLFSHGGSKDDGTTDGNGVARLEDSPVRTAKVKIADPKALRKALKPQWNQVRGDRKWLDEAQGVTVVRLVGNNLPSFDLVADKVRVISIQPSVARVRLIGPYFDTNKAFVLPAVRRALPSVVFIQKELNAKRMLVVGHTDTTGRSSYNDQLSLDRAQAIKDFLLRDVSAWYKWYGPGMAAEKRWGSKEDLAMIDALPDGAERGGTETPIRWFQRTRGLVVDGVAGEKTRRALIAEYMNLDEKLLEESELVVHGCGESFPDKATEDDTEEPDNRRIEIFFFDTDLGILPAPTKQVSSAGSTDYPEWVRRSKRTDDFEQDGVSIALRIVDGLGEPLVGAPYELKAGSVQRAAKTDANGLLHEEQIPRATSCILRWALPPRPGDPSPAPPTYDFEREILLDFEGRERDEAARYRLHNLGYDSPDLNESVHDFQQDFGLARADWFDEKTWNELRRLHDDF